MRTSLTGYVSASAGASAYGQFLGTVTFLNVSKTLGPRLEDNTMVPAANSATWAIGTYNTRIKAMDLDNTPTVYAE